MDKKEFLNRFTFDDKTSLASLYEKIKIAERVSYPLYTNEFYTPNVIDTLKSIKELSHIDMKFLGGFEESERKIIGFNSENCYDMPYSMLRIKCKSKFHSLTHRDFLGAIVSLGIVREKFGDLIVEGNEAYIPVINEIAPYILNNLTSISNTSCEVSIVDNIEEIPKVNFKDIDIISSSLRIDCIVGAITKVSRNTSEKLIKEGKVLLNYSALLEKSREISMEDIVTIRGYGKFKVLNILGNTSSGRIKIRIKKYS